MLAVRVQLKGLLGHDHVENNAFVVAVVLDKECALGSVLKLVGLLVDDLFNVLGIGKVGVGDLSKEEQVDVRVEGLGVMTGKNKEFESLSCFVQSVPAVRDDFARLELGVLELAVFVNFQLLIALFINPCTGDQQSAVAVGIGVRRSEHIASDNNAAYYEQYKDDNEKNL